MALPRCQLTYLLEPPTGYIRIVGRAAVEGARDFKALVERLKGQGAGQICLDLSGCLLMDSTFSGVLAQLATAANQARGQGQCPTIMLYCPNARVVDLLDSLGVLPLVGVLEEAPMPGDFSGHEPGPDSGDKVETAECCLEAHRILMTLRPENVGRFSELTRMLEQQIQAAPPG